MIAHSPEIGAIDLLLTAIYEHYFGGGLDLNIPGGPGDAMDLLRVLQDGVAAGRAREQRFHTGNLIPEDWIPRPAV